MKFPNFFEKRGGGVKVESQQRTAGQQENPIPNPTTEDEPNGERSQTFFPQRDLLFELGPRLEKAMSWYEAQKEIKKINKALPKGETPWRLPTKKEWRSFLRPLRLAEEDGASKEELEQIFEEIKIKYNLKPEQYWSSDVDFEYPTDAWVINMGGGGSGLTSMNNGSCLVLLVR
jgi:hypothetical protein